MPNKERATSLPIWYFTHSTFHVPLFLPHPYPDNTLSSEEEYKKIDPAFSLYFKPYSQEKPSQHRQRGREEVEIQVFNLIGLSLYTKVKLLIKKKNKTKY